MTRPFDLDAYFDATVAAVRADISATRRAIGRKGGIAFRDRWGVTELVAMGHRASTVAKRRGDQAQIPAGAAEQEDRPAPAPAGPPTPPPVALTALDLDALRYAYTLRAPALRRLLDAIEARQPLFSP